MSLNYCLVKKPQKTKAAHINRTWECKKGEVSSRDGWRQLELLWAPTGQGCLSWSGPGKSFHGVVEPGLQAQHNPGFLVLWCSPQALRSSHHWPGPPMVLKGQGYSISVTRALDRYVQVLQEIPGLESQGWTWVPMDLGLFLHESRQWGSYPSISRTAFLEVIIQICKLL